MKLGFSYSLLLAQSVFVKLLFFFFFWSHVREQQYSRSNQKKKIRKGCFICSAAGSSVSLYTYITLSPYKCSACRGGNLQRSTVFQRQHVETSEQKFRHRLSLMPRAADLKRHCHGKSCWSQFNMTETHHSRFSFVFTAWHFCIRANKVGSWNRCDFFCLYFCKHFICILSTVDTNIRSLQISSSL